MIKFTVFGIVIVVLVAIWIWLFGAAIREELWKVVLLVLLFSLSLFLGALILCTINAGCMQWSGF